MTTLTCPEWCSECRSDAGFGHPDDLSTTHSRIWDVAGWPLGGVSLEEFVYESDASVGQRDITLWSRADGSRRCHWMEHMSAEQARGLAEALLEAADMLEAAGGYISGL